MGSLILKRFIGDILHINMSRFQRRNIEFECKNLVFWLGPKEIMVSLNPTNVIRDQSGRPNVKPLHRAFSEVTE